jgi:hypothetical protein
MDIETMFTETPYFLIVNEYETQPKMEDLTEIFVVTYKIKLPNWQQKPDPEENLKESLRYVFFTDLERAIKQYKYYGPRGATLARMFTDKEEIIEIAEKSNFKLIEEEEEKEEVKEEEKEKEKPE